MKRIAMKTILCVAAVLLTAPVEGQTTRPTVQQGNQQDQFYGRRQQFDQYGGGGGGGRRRFGQNGGGNNPYNSFQAATTQADSTPTPPAINGSYTLLTVRSIFSRQPLVDPNPQPMESPIRDEDRLVFVGVMDTLGQGTDRLVAFLEDSNSQQTAPVKIGDQVAGGKVTGITLDQMDFLAHGITQHLLVGQNLAGAQVFGAMPAATTLPSSLDFSGAHGDILKAMALRRLKEQQGIGGK